MAGVAAAQQMKKNAKKMGYVSVRDDFTFLNWNFSNLFESDNFSREVKSKTW